MRSILELLIGIATRETGSMSKRIGSIPFIDPEEKKKVDELWGEFCAWSHPYRKWEEEVCPIFALQKPIYYQRLCKMSLDKLERIIDLLLVIALEKFEIDKQGILSKLNTRSVGTPNLTLFQAHVNPNRGK
jgi:hypothetical protein